MNNQQAEWTPAVRRYGAELVAWGEEIARLPWPPAPGAQLAVVDTLDAARAAGLRDLPRSASGLPGVLRAYVNGLLRRLGALPLVEAELAAVRKEYIRSGSDGSTRATSPGALARLNKVVEDLLYVLEGISLYDLPPGIADIVNNLAEAAGAYEAADKTR